MKILHIGFGAEERIAGFLRRCKRPGDQIWVFHYCDDFLDRAEKKYDKALGGKRLIINRWYREDFGWFMESLDLIKDVQFDSGFLLFERMEEHELMKGKGFQFDAICLQYKPISRDYFSNAEKAGRFLEKMDQLLGKGGSFVLSVKLPGTKGFLDLAGRFFKEKSYTVRMSQRGRYVRLSAKKP